MFFYRDESGGCALFDQLGWPWPLHECWVRYREQTLDRVEQELNDAGFNGTFYKRGVSYVTRPTDETEIEVSGYVSDNHALYREEDRVIVRLKSAPKVTTTTFVAVEVCDGKRGYRFLMSQDAAKEIPDYSLIEVRGTWMKHGKRWRLFATSYRSVEPKQKRAAFRKLSQVRPDCSYCSKPILEGERWGIDTEGMRECSPCGQLRGYLDRKAFLQRIRAIFSRLSREAG